MYINACITHTFKEFKNAFLAPDLVRAAQLQFYLPHFLPERFQMPDASGFRTEAAAQQPFTDHDFPRMGGMNAAIVDAPVVNDAQTAAHHALHGVNRALLLVPPGSGIVGFTEMGSHLFHPFRLQPGGAAHPQARGVHQLHTHHPFAPLLAAEQAGTGKDAEGASPGAAVFPVVRIPEAELARNARQDAPVNHGEGSLPFHFRLQGGDPAFQGLLQQPGKVFPQVEPFHHAVEIEEVFPAPFPELVFVPAPAFPELPRSLPQFEQGQEIAVFILPLRVGLVRLLRGIRRTFPGIHDAQAGHNHQHLRQGLFMLRFQQHAAQPRVNGQPRQLPAHGRELPGLVQGADFPQGAVALRDQLGGRRVRKGEFRHFRKTQVLHPEKSPGQRAAPDFRVREVRPVLPVLLTVQADADALAHAAAAASTLARAGLGDGFYLKPLHLPRRTVAADSRQAGVNDVNDAGNGQGRFRHVGRPAPAYRPAEQSGACRETP